MSSGSFASADQPLLEIKRVNVDYAADNGTVHAVTDVSLALRRGRILGLAGESGCGKSTLAYAITRLLRPPAEITSGEILYYPGAVRVERARTRSMSGFAPGLAPGSVARDGAPEEPVDVLRLSSGELRAFRWREIAIVFQSAMNALNPVLSVGVQIMDVLRTHRPAMRAAERQVRAVELLRLVGIAPDRLRSFPHELSGGMRQRAIIAIALALAPELIIMDEPTTALDVVVQREILLELMGLRAALNFSVIFITHDLSLLLEIADEIAIMYAGRVVETATSADLQRQPLHPYTYGMLNSFPTIYGARRRMTGIPGTPPDLRSIPSGCAFHPRCPLAFAPCASELPLLRLGEARAPEHRVACHLYDPRHLSGAPPTSADFATRYESAYARALGEAVGEGSTE